MVFLYYTGLINPKPTDFWLIRYGFPILILEFLSVFSILILPNLINNGFKDKVSLYVLFTILLMAFVLTININIFLFLYFILSIFIKYFVFKKQKVSVGFMNDFKGIMVTTFAFLTSLSLAFVFSSSLINIYPDQIEILKQFIIEEVKVNIKGEIFNNPSLVALWGMLHFAFLFIFTLLIDFSNIKRSKLNHRSF